MVVKPATRRKATRTAGRISSRKLLGSLIAVAMLVIVGVVGTRAAISATTGNAGNQFNAGTINLADNDAARHVPGQQRAARRLDQQVHQGDLHRFAGQHGEAVHGHPHRRHRPLRRP